MLQVTSIAMHPPVLRSDCNALASALHAAFDCRDKHVEAENAYLAHAKNAEVAKTNLDGYVYALLELPGALPGNQRFWCMC